MASVDCCRSAEVKFVLLSKSVCERTGIKLFVLPPKSPKLNGCAERAQSTQTEEFYEVKTNLHFQVELSKINMG
jgi:hypothetical protein